MLAIVGGIAMLAILASAFYLLGPGKPQNSGGADGSSADTGWASGDVRTVSHNGVCQPIVGLAARLVPNADPVGRPSTRTDVATCHWTNLRNAHNPNGKSRYRTLSVTVEPYSPSHGLDEAEPATEVAKDAFRQTVQENKSGPLGEKVQDSRSVPGIGDEAFVVYSVGRTDAGIAHLVVRRRNVEMDITYQGSDNSLRGNPQEGYYPVAKPLSRSSAEQGALAIARRLVAEFR